MLRLVNIMKIFYMGGVSVAKQSVWMCAVIQCDFSSQMDVFRWIMQDKQYRACYIIHGRDIVEEERVRVLSDGSETLLLKGSLKPEHIHMIIRIPKKLTADTFSKRFGCYVNFQLCADPSEYARYLTHNTFDSQDKARYSPAEVDGDMTLYSELTQISQSDDIASHVSRFFHFAEMCGDFSTTVHQISDAGDVDLLRSIMSHAYFYKAFFKGV